MIEKGCDISLQNNRRETAIDLAKTQEIKDFIAKHKDEKQSKENLLLFLSHKGPQNKKKKQRKKQPHRQILTQMTFHHLRK